MIIKFSAKSCHHFLRSYIDSTDPFILILAGQTDLKRIMQYAIMEPLNQRLRMNYHMPPFDQKQTTAYLEQQLKYAGSKEPIFENNAVDAIHELSFGIPRRIGTMALQAMLYAMCDDKRTVNAEVVLKVKAGG